MHIKSRIIALSALCLFAFAVSGAHAVEFVFAVKPGHLRLNDTSQPIGEFTTMPLNFSRDASDEYAVSFEVRKVFGKVHALSAGPEFITYKNSYTPAVAGAAPTAASEMGLVSVRYYYYGFSPQFRPFVGLGVGAGETRVAAYSNYSDTNTVEYFTFGFETLINEAAGLVVQFMDIGNDSSGNGTYDGSARGVFIGLRLGF